MKLKVLKDFVLFNGKYFRINSEIELEDKIAKDLIKGEYVIELSSIDDTKPIRRKKKKEGEE